MIGELLLYLMVTDLREVGDEELRDYLEVMLGLLAETDDSPELRERTLDQLEAGAPDREAIAAWPDEYLELLPTTMAGYDEALERFDQLLEEVFEGEQEATDRLARFRHCLELLQGTDEWQPRAEAARGIGALEEELFQCRDDYVAIPISLDQCSPASVVAHRYLLEGFETWQDAFRLAHSGELDEALDTAIEGTCVFRAVEQWSQPAS